MKPLPMHPVHIPAVHNYSFLVKYTPLWLDITAAAHEIKEIKELTGQTARLRLLPSHPERTCLRSLKSSLAGKGEGVRFPSTEFKLDIRLWQLLGGSGRRVDRKHTPWCIRHLTLLGQEGLRGPGWGAATQTGFHRQLLVVQTLRG